jgi:hypothetical protein
MDDHKRRVKGYRRAGRVCPCCAEAPKRQAVRMARHRLRAEDRRTIGPALIEERIDDALDAEYREIEAAGGLTFRRADSLIDGTRYPEAVDLCPWSPQWCG